MPFKVYAMLPSLFVLATQIKSSPRFAAHVVAAEMVSSEVSELGVQQAN